VNIGLANSIIVDMHERTRESKDTIVSSLAAISINWEKLSNQEKYYISKKLGGHCHQARLLVLFEAIFNNLNWEKGDN